MSRNVTIDTSLLEMRFSELMGALNGRMGDGDLQSALRVEAGQCAWRIAQSLGPSTKQSAINRLDKDMRQHLSVKPTFSNLSDEQKYSSTADFTWLAAAPGSLVGINDEDNQRDASAPEVMAMYYAGRQSAPRGLAYVKLGQRGKQAIMRLNRIRVSKSAFASVKRAIGDRIGQSKAAWAATAASYLRNKAIPAWVRRQIPVVIATGKHVLSDQGLTSDRPWLEFGSRARGVESNPFVVQKIRAGVRATVETLAAKVRKIIAGQTYNWNTGQVFRPTQFEDN